MNKYYKIYPQFSSFAKELLEVDLYNFSDYRRNGREEIYDRLRLPMKSFEGNTKIQIDEIVNRHFTFDNFFFSIIQSENISQIHTDTHYRKSKSHQRYCNLAFPIYGNLENRLTFWPNLNEQDSIDCFKNSHVNDDSLSKYADKNNWLDFVEHKLYQPVLLNTALPHAAMGQGKTLFAYITLIGKSYVDCIDLYDAMSSSATI